MYKKSNIHISLSNVWTKVLSLFLINPKFQASSRFVSDLVGNPRSKFSSKMAHIAAVFGWQPSVIQMESQIQDNGVPIADSRLQHLFPRRPEIDHTRNISE